MAAPPPPLASEAPPHSPSSSVNTISPRPSIASSADVPALPKDIEARQFGSISQPFSANPGKKYASGDDDAIRLAPTRTNEEQLFQSLSRRRTSHSAAAAGPTIDELNPEIEQLLSRIFGHSRQDASQEERSRHLGVVFRDLTVRGLGIGASLQPTVSDIFLAPLRALAGLVAGSGFHRPAVRTLIHGFTGSVEPGELLLVLGRPGAGCSTFLKVLGNQRSGFEEVTGHVSYGGQDWRVMAECFRSEVLYNPEEDLHYATLTVRDTLRFALQTKTPGKDSRSAGETRGAYVQEFLRVVSKLFWIEHTLDTRLGGDIIRGVSGGEKKRVSIAEAMVAKASCQCWDNSTKGLDASTAMEYVSSLRALTNMAKISTSVALYQAGESLYDLFDKVLLIDEGRCAYFGQAEDAKKYFEDLGFECPPRWTTADFLTSVTDPNERHVKPGYEDRIPRNAQEFETAFRNSPTAARNLADIERFEASVREKQVAEARLAAEAAKKNYTIGFTAQVLACTKRQFKVLLGDKFSLGAKWIGILFQSIIVGTLFLNVRADASGVFPRGGVLFLCLLFNALLAMAELTAAFESRPILMKHKSFSFYRPSAYAIAQVVVDLPLCAIQVLEFGTIIYFMSNLARTASQFFTFILITFFCTLSMYSFFRMLGAYSGSLNAATRVTGVAVQALIVYTGYLIPPVSMHPWFKWLMWINPVQYGFEALMANEFHGLNVECTPPFLVPAGAPGATPEHQSCLIRGSSPGSTVVRGDAYIQSQFSYSRSHLWRNLGIVIGFWLFFSAMTALGLEFQKPNMGGAAVTVYKRGQTPKSIERAIEKGAAPPPDVETADTGAGVPISADAEKKETGGTLGTHRAHGAHGADADRLATNDTVFTWQNVTYTIPTKSGDRVLLNDVSGYVRPGKLTALMGESGAGKTTLLNTLAQRIKFGTVHGSFLVNGQPLPLSFQRATGFAEQQDIHEPTTTVREAMRFSALLRQPKEVPIQEKYEYAEKIIRLLEMEDIAGATVGTQGVGLNQEQRKRLTIGVELASKPELLMFLDEPTSGLDSAAAFNVVRFLRKLADAGQAILCTIHQPSAVLFEYFDEMVLLKSGGTVVYHGPLGTDSSTLIRYFEGNGAPKCPKHKNPAEYMLEAIGAGDPNRKNEDWGSIWKKSPECQQRQEEIEAFIRDREGAGPRAVDDRQFAMPITAQMMAVLKRTFTSYWRSPEYTIGLMMLHIFTGLFNSFSFYKLGFTNLDMQGRLFSIFMTLTIAPPLIQQLQPKFLSIRNLFVSRENNSKIYHWSAWVLSAVVVEIPYRLVAGTVYFIVWYFPIDFPRDSATVGYNWLMMMLFELYYLGFGQAIASFSPNELMASLLVPIFFMFIVAFCGVLVPYAAMPWFWRVWMYPLSPFTYVLEGFLGTLTHQVPVRCAEAELAKFTPPPNTTCSDYVQGFLQLAGGYVEERAGECRFCAYEDGDQFVAGFNIKYGHRWRDVAIVVGYVVFNFAMVFVCTWIYLGGAKRAFKRALRR